MNNEDWTWQLSLKLGQDRSALLNVRAKDIAEFAEALRSLTSNAPEITAAAALFESKRDPDFGKNRLALLATQPVGSSVPTTQLHVAREAGDDSLSENVRTGGGVPPPAPKPTGNQLGTEIGPFLLRAEAKAFIAKTGKNAGKASTRYVASLPGGIVASTFDELYGSILLQLNGKNAFARVDKNEKGYYNLVSVRPA